MPDGSHCERGSVVIVNAEDGLEDTVKPRLEVAEADIPAMSLAKLFLWKTGGKRSSSPASPHALKKKIEECEAVIAIIDPLRCLSRKGKINSWNDQHIRRAMAPLSQLAHQTGVAIVLDSPSQQKRRS